MTNTTKTLLAVAVVAAAPAIALAGGLEPAGPPAPTMVTLQQLYDRQHDLLRSDTCFDNSGRNRFVDCGANAFGTSNGTVKDMQTGLIWLKDTACIAATNWADASIKAAALANGQCGLSDGSKAGDWRLPTKEEWAALIKPSCYPSPGPPVLPDKLGTGCYATGTQWATGVQSAFYWSSSTYTTTDPDFAWVGNFSSSVANVYVFKGSNSYVWPVRGGQ